MTLDEKLASRCVAFERDGDTIRVKLDRANEPWIVARVVNGALDLYPERSSGHKKLNDRLV